MTNIWNRLQPHHRNIDFGRLNFSGKWFFLIFIIHCVWAPTQAQNSQDSLWFRQNYTKKEVMIPMRDGIKLFTSIYIPKDLAEAHPIIMRRTPYSCYPYGQDEYAKLYDNYYNYYLRDNYIIVSQDVRGRFMSEGEFEDIRPIVANKRDNKATDETTDTYDTVDWLINNIDNNNGKVGIMGISYPGFYSTVAALSGHPAVKAVSPQAPVTDWYRGDDFHHNGALALLDGFNFYLNFGRPRPKPTKEFSWKSTAFGPDAYRFFLDAGSLTDIKNNYFGDSIRFWNDLYAHPDLDQFWEERNPLPHVKDVQPAIMVVGGLFDAEDCYGAWKTYEAFSRQSPETKTTVVMGPWFHGHWGGRGNGDHLGDIQFGSKTSEWYQNEFEIPFFKKYLQNNPTPTIGNTANVFITGANQWAYYDQWPPKGLKETKLFLSDNNQLAFNPKKATTTFDQYTSDPNHPVPYRADISWSRNREYMNADQRFASQRPDVLTYQTDILTEDITALGPVMVDLFVGLSTTDADFVVKVIDVFPDDFKEYKSEATPMGGYQMLVRGEIFRGRYRESFSKPKAFKPGKIEQVKYAMPDISHTFKKGHRIMVQIQSSWFPLFDRNPQQMVDIYRCKKADFVKSDIKVYRTLANASNISIMVK